MGISQENIIEWGFSQSQIRRNVEASDDPLDTFINNVLDKAESPEKRTQLNTYVFGKGRFRVLFERRKVREESLIEIEEAESIEDLREQGVDIFPSTTRRQAIVIFKRQRGLTQEEAEEQADRFGL